MGEHTAELSHMRFLQAASMAVEAIPVPQRSSRHVLEMSQLACSRLPRPCHTQAPRTHSATHLASMSSC
jgi:hypothetical protein